MFGLRLVNMVGPMDSRRLYFEFKDDEESVSQ